MFSVAHLEAGWRLATSQKDTCLTGDLRPAAKVWEEGWVVFRRLSSDDCRKAGEILCIQ